MAEHEILKRGMTVDRYEIRALLGEGGQGQVYRAYDPVLKRSVVIKTLARMGTDELKRFTLEAEAISKMSHNNVVDILDFRVIEGRPYIVMEYLAGQDLAARLAQGPLAVGEAVDIVLAVTAGVFACHRRGIVHRDLKPKNVFLAKSPDYGTVVKVLDFGIARKVQGRENITLAGSVVGTPRYMAPEQLQGSAEIDERTDQYGVGMLLYVCLVGESPWGNLRDSDLVRAILMGDCAGPRRLRPEVPQALEAIIMRAMAVKRETRFPSLHALGQELLRFASPDGQAMWTGHFTNIPQPLVTIVSAPLSDCMAKLPTVSTAGARPWALEHETTEKDPETEKMVRPAQGLAPTKVLPPDEKITEGRPDKGGMKRWMDALGTEGKQLVEYAAEARTPLPIVSSQSTRTANPTPGQPRPRSPRVWLALALACLAASGGAWALATWWPVPNEAQVPRGRPMAVPVLGTPDAGLTVAIQPVAPAPADTPAVPAGQASGKPEAHKPARGEKRRKKSASGSARLQFLKDGSPLLE